MVAHDREAARQAFEAALAVSPSCALWLRQLQPNFTIGRMFAAAGYHPSVAQPLSERFARRGSQSK